MQYHHYNIVSLNVNRLNNPIKRSKMIAEIKKERINFTFWQEMHASSADHEKLKKWALGILSSHPTKMVTKAEFPF